MSVKKKLLSGKAFSWGYEFAIGPRGDRQRYKQGGFATRTEAINAESAKRLEIERGEKSRTPARWARRSRSFSRTGARQ
jgi:hypothetical protein